MFMIATIVSIGVKAVVWGLAVVGFAGRVRGWMIATPVRPRPELTSAADTARAVDHSDMRGLERFHADDVAKAGGGS
jgi:hypothetical protein